MKKSDLKSGMTCELSDGTRYLVFRNPNNVLSLKRVIKGKIKDESEWTSTNSLEDDMSWTGGKIPPIIKVWHANRAYEIISYLDKDLIWERKEEKHLCTIDGVEYSESTLLSIIKKAHSID